MISYPANDVHNVEYFFFLFESVVYHLDHGKISSSVSVHIFDPPIAVHNDSETKLEFNIDRTEELCSSFLHTYGFPNMGPIGTRVQVGQVGIPLIAGGKIKVNTSCTSCGSYLHNDPLQFHHPLHGLSQVDFH